MLCAAGAAVVAIWKADFTGRHGNGLGEGFQYDLSALRQFPAGKLAYEEVPLPPAQARAMAQVKNPHAIFIDGDDEYVVSDNGILMPLTDPPACPFTPLESAQCVAAVRGVTYVGMTDHVLVLDPANKKSEWAKIEGTPHVTSIAATEKDVFVADAGNRVLWHYDTSGKLLGTIGKADKAKGIDGFIVPSPHFKIAIAPDGLLRVANPGRLCVEAYTAQGDLEWRWGQAGTTDAGFSGCCNPAALAIFPDGRIVTAEKGELAMVKVCFPGCQRAGQPSSNRRRTGAVPGAEKALGGDGAGCSRGPQWLDSRAGPGDGEDSDLPAETGGDKLAFDGDDEGKI